MKKIAVSILTAMALTIAADASGSVQFSTERHALRGEAWAEEALATDFATGVGEPKDPLEAAALYALAARQGMMCSLCLRREERRLTMAQRRLVHDISSGSAVRKGRI